MGVKRKIAGKLWGIRIGGMNAMEVEVKVCVDMVVV